MLAAAINEGLSGTPEGIGVGRPAEFHFTAATPDLLRFAWHQLALFVTGDVPLSKCEFCGRIFDPGRRGERFCSKRCGDRSRARTYYEKHPEKRGGRKEGSR
jgi:hypothetical protein